MSVAPTLRRFTLPAESATRTDRLTARASPLPSSRPPQPLSARRSSVILSAPRPEPGRSSRSSQRRWATSATTGATAAAAPGRPAMTSSVPSRLDRGQVEPPLASAPPSVARYCELRVDRAPQVRGRKRRPAARAGRLELAQVGDIRGMTPRIAGGVGRGPERVRDNDPLDEVGRRTGSGRSDRSVVQILHVAGSTSPVRAPLRRREALGLPVHSSIGPAADPDRRLRSGHRTTIVAADSPLFTTVV